MNLNEIKQNAQEIDADQLHRFLIKEVQDGKYDTCLEALTSYVEENDVNLDTIQKHISPALKAIIYKEASDRQLIKDPLRSLSLEQFF